ncbi:vacuolar protein sorting-associated [Globomyces pollinis-pini]|nr:vacuolar protein sorting-associated [Globomyces pollinis-pini]
MGDKILDQRVKLVSNNIDRDHYDQLADLYSIIIATEHLERAYIRSAISPQDYTPMCQQLIGQYKTLVGLLNLDVKQFIAQYKMTCPAATKRLVEIGVPATVEHASVDTQSSAKNIAETVQFFITIMDALKLNCVAVDEIHPQLSDLIQTLNKSPISALQGKTKIKEWLILLNQMKASDELNENQVRQLLFDLESAYAEFQTQLK